uniref:Reverse transcriptase domain-containing protein n=1 Tax=Strongyloides stercoralis TaxID=6248 RepID=A0A0K0DS47_STRER
MVQNVKNWEIEMKSKDDKTKNAAGFNLRKVAKKLRCADENPKVILNQLKEKISKFNRGLINMEIRKKNSILATRFGHKPSMKTLNFLKSSKRKQKSELDNRKARTFYSNLAKKISDNQRKKTIKVDEFIEENMKHRTNVKNIVDFNIIKEAFDDTIKFTAPWKAPGPDCISGYAWKHFDCLKEKLFNWILSIIKGEEMIMNTDCTGITYLLFKKGDKKDPANYRPITCLGVYYKILTACISKYLLNFFKMNPEINELIFPSNQIAGRKNVRSTNYAHLIDKAIQLDKKYSIQKKGDKLNLYMGYVDFKKAYDSVHKDIILKILESSGIDKNISLILKQIMDKWRTTISLNDKILKPYTIGRGVLQGDSMSPLLFIFSISPISWFLNKEKKVCLKRNQLMYSQKPINHLFYMDDLKFYTDDSKELKKFFNITKNIAKEIGLSMNTNKSAKIENNDKELDLNELNELQSDVERNEFIPEVFDTYTYLGIDQKKLDNSKISLKRISD